MTTKSAFSVIGLAHKVCLAAEAQGYDPELLNALAEDPHLFGEMLQVQWGHARVIPAQRDEKGHLKKQSSVVQVDQSVKPISRRLVHPFYTLGPSEFDVNGLKRWHPAVSMNHEKLYEYLLGQDLLKYCLGLSDIEAIRMKGIAFFRQFFGEETSRITAFRSVAIGRHDELNFPFVYKTGGECLDFSWAEPEIRWAPEDPVYFHYTTM